MQQAQIPVLPAANILISTIRRKVDTECLHLSILSWPFTVVFSVDNKSLSHDASSTCIPVSTWAKIFILTIIVHYSHFHLLPIFHPVALKFMLVHNKIWGTEEFNVDTFLLNILLMKKLITMLRWLFIGILIRHGRNKQFSLSYCNTNTHIRIKHGVACMS
jgi:hypothetical protein